MLKFSEYTQIMKGTLTEAFQAKDMHKVVSLMQKSLENQLGKKLYQMPGVETYVNSEGKGFGVQYFISGTSNSVRFNFGKKNEIVSVDVWGNDGSRDPQVRVHTKGISIARIIPFIADQIKSPKVGQYEVDIRTGDIVYESYMEEDDVLSEAKENVITPDGQHFKNKKEAAIHMLKTTEMSRAEIAKAIGASGVLVSNAAREAGVVKVVNVTKGQAEQPVASPEEQAALKAFNDKKVANPEELFKDLETLIGMVVNKIQPSLIITGMAGIGKTFTVTQMLEASGLRKNSDYIHIKGSSSAAGLYRTLFLHRQPDKIIVFDDCDDVFSDKQAVNILKGALDSDEPREVSWVSANSFNAIGLDDEEIQAEFDAEEGRKFPNQFRVQSRIIFISNLPQAKFPKALLSRSFSIDISLKAKDVVKRMRSILADVMPQAKMDDKVKVIDYLEKEGKFISTEDNPLNIRTLQKSIKLQASGAPNWQTLVARYAG